MSFSSSRELTGQKSSNSTYQRSSFASASFLRVLASLINGDLTENLSQLSKEDLEVIFKNHMQSDRDKPLVNPLPEGIMEVGESQTANLTKNHHTESDDDLLCNEEVSRDNQGVPGSPAMVSSLRSPEDASLTEYEVRLLCMIKMLKSHLTQIITSIDSKPSSRQ